MSSQYKIQLRRSNGIDSEGSLVLIKHRERVDGVLETLLAVTSLKVRLDPWVRLNKVRLPNLFCLANG